MKPYLKGFSKRYESIPLPTSGRWFDTAKVAALMLANGGIVLLYGPRGTGKSFMAWDVSSHGRFPDPAFADLSPRPIINLTAMELFLQIRDTWRKSSKLSELELIDQWTSAALLVIDEIQERGETVFENQKLTAIVDARYRAMRPTLMIGNYQTPQEMSASLGSSIASRIQELGGAIRCDWPSFRGNANMEAPHA
jgi:DNA replication protein DnaC